MSILIKGMHKPKSCQGCGLLQEFDECYWCGCNSYLVFGDIENVPDYVMNGCPLVEIPKHGRLIDADKLKADNPRHMDADVPYVTEVTVEEIIDEAPTVIEGEEE